MLDSCIGIISHIVAIDQSSTDDTTEKLTAWSKENNVPCIVLINEKMGSSEFSRTNLVDAIGSSGYPLDWVLVLDGDEELTQPLRERLVDVMYNPSAYSQTGYYIRRRNIFSSASGSSLGETVEDNQLRLLRWPIRDQENRLHTTFRAHSTGLIQEEMLHRKSAAETLAAALRYEELWPGYCDLWNSQWPSHWWDKGVLYTLREASKA